MSNTPKDDAERFVRPEKPERPAEGYLDETVTMDLTDVAQEISRLGKNDPEKKEAESGAADEAADGTDAEGQKQGNREHPKQERDVDPEDTDKAVTSDTDGGNETVADADGGKEDVVTDAVEEKEIVAADADGGKEDVVADAVEEKEIVAADADGEKETMISGADEENESGRRDLREVAADAAEEALDELTLPESGEVQASGKEKRKGFFRRHMVLTVLLIVFVVFDSVAGAGYGYFHSKYRLMQISNGEVDQPAEMTAEEEKDNAIQNEALKKQTADIAEAKTIQAEGDIFSDSDVYNILLIGSDDRTKKFNENARGDTCILLSINKERKQVHLVSFERASGMPILDGEYEGQYDWLTHTFRYGGASLMTREVRECFKLDVTKYIRVNIWTFIKLVDAVGGVDIDMTEAEADNINHPEGTYTEGYIKGMHVQKEVQQDLHVGVNHLNGATAMCYARLRSIDSDWFRVQRQRKVILAAVEQLKKLNVTELDNLLNQVLPMVQTNLTESDCAELITLVPEYLNADFDDFTMPFKNTYGMMTGMEGRRMFAVDFDTCAKILHSVLYNGADAERLQTYYENLSQPTYYTSASYKAANGISGNNQTGKGTSAGTTQQTTGSAGSGTAAGTSSGTGTAASQVQQPAASGTAGGQSGIPAETRVDPNTGYLYDPNTGIVYDPNSGAAIGTVPDTSVLNQGAAQSQGAGAADQTGTAGAAAGTGTDGTTGAAAGTGADGNAAGAVGSAGAAAGNGTAAAGAAAVPAAQ